MKRFEKFCVYFIMSILCMILTYLTYTSFVRTAYTYDWEDTLFINDNYFLNAAAVIAVSSAAAFCLRRKLSIGDNFLKVYIIIVNAVMVWFILSTQLLCVDDQNEVLSAASAFLNGNYEPWNTGGYCFRWGHQNGIVLIYAFFSWVFGQGNVTVFQLLNLVFIGATYYFIYKTQLALGISKNLSRLIYISLYAFVPYMIYVTYVYGTVIGLMFATIGFYSAVRFLDDMRIRNAAACVLSLGMATVCKSNYYIFIIAFCIIVLVNTLCCNTPEIKHCMLKKAALVAAVILMCIAVRLTTTFVITQNIGKTAPEGTPTILFVVMGLQEGWRAPGWSNSFDDIMYAQCNYDNELACEVGIQWFKNEAVKFIYNPDYFVSFFNRKLASLWANPTWECFEILKSRTANTSVPGVIQAFMDVGSPLNLFITELLDILQTLLYFGALMYCLFGIKKARIKDLFFVLTFVGAFIFFIVWEGRCHYTVPIAVYLIPAAAMGYSMLGRLLSGLYDGITDVGILKYLRSIDYRHKINATNVWLTLVVFAWIIAGYMMIDYAIWQEDGTYASFLNSYTYGTRINDGSYTLTAYQDDSLTLSTKTVEDGEILTLSGAEDDTLQYFTVDYHFYENGLNHYYIYDSKSSKMLYIIDESLMYNSNVYLYHYNLSDKYLWNITDAGDGAFYIKNIYGMALSYNIYTNDVVLMPYVGEDYQKWYIR